MSYIKQWLGEYLIPPPHLSPIEQRYYSIASLTYPLGVGLHLLMTVLPLLVFNVPKLALYNIISVGIWIIAIILIRTQKLATAVLLATFEIMLHALLCGLWLGWSFGFQYYLILLLSVAFISPLSRRLQILIAILTIGLFLFLTFFSGAWVGDPSIPAAMQIFNIASSLILISMLAGYNRQITDRAESQLAEAHAKSERLLLNALPDIIAKRLKQGDGTIADGFAETSVLFADIADFTPLSQRMAPAEVVHMLDDLFSRFDALVRKHKLEKIKTIGDAYMVAAGVPTQRADHAEVMALFARDMQQAIREYNAETGAAIQLRIGINSGPVVAGVIGKMRFLYDLWGDSVNTASRMESHGIPDEIQVSENTKALLDSHYRFEDRGLIEIKGKGLMRTYFLREALNQPMMQTA